MICQETQPGEGDSSDRAITKVKRVHMHPSHNFVVIVNGMLNYITKPQRNVIYVVHDIVLHVHTHLFSGSTLVIITTTVEPL